MANHDGETQLTLRIDLDADPIAGSLSSPHGTHHRFSGWIALAAALEATRRELAPGPRRQPGSSDSAQAARRQRDRSI